MPLPKTINYLTINTGLNIVTAAYEVRNDVIERLIEWLPARLNTGKYNPLPMPDLENFIFRFTAEGSALFVNLNGTRMPQPNDPPGMSMLIPLLSFGVAPDEGAANMLWPVMLQHCPRVAPVPRPAAPWCVVATYPALDDYPDNMEWAPDFERCLAWAWINQTEPLKEPADPLPVVL